VIIFGWLPPSFGLGWWALAGSIVAGTVVGTLFTAPLALVSLRTATNLSTSSGAQFGVRVRLVGSVVGLLLALGYTALTVWIGGDVMVGVLGRLFGLPAGGEGRRTPSSTRCSPGRPSRARCTATGCCWPCPGCCPSA
jgi:purine-cytosine permease-like protein